MIALPYVIVVMGVSGSGKSTIGPRLAEHFGCAFIEGDDLHTTENIDKMRAGVALTDSDRWPWLGRIGATASKAAHANGRVVVACSALKKSYRDRIRETAGCTTLFVLLDASKAELGRRLSLRHHHYMPASLLESQLALLEPPGPGELARRFEPGSESASDVDRITAWIHRVLAECDQAD